MKRIIIFIILMLSVFNLNAQLRELNCTDGVMDSIISKTNFNDSYLLDLIDLNTIFRTTPSTVIIAGTGLTWSGNTLNATGSGTGDVSFTDTTGLDKTIFTKYDGDTLQEKIITVQEQINDTVYGLAESDSLTLYVSKYKHDSTIAALNDSIDDLRTTINTLPSSGSGSSILTLFGIPGTTPNMKLDTITHPALDTTTAFVFVNGLLRSDSSNQISQIDSNLVFTPNLTIGDTMLAMLFSNVTALTLQDTNISSGEAIAHYQFEQTLDDTLGNYDGTVITSITYENTIPTLDNYYITIDAARGMTLPQINFGDAFSISGWCQLGVTAGEKCIMDALESNDGFEIGWILGVDPSTNPDSLYIITGNGVTTDTLYSTSDNSFAQGNTYHFVYTMDRILGEGKIYVDAVDITGTGDILTDFETNVTSYIGRTAANDKWWTKQMDDLQFYNYVVDQTDVTWLYNNIGNRLE